MLKMLLNGLLGIRNLFQNMFGKLMKKAEDSNTGKIKFIKPGSLPVILWVVALVFFFVIVLSQMIGKDKFREDGVEGFKKEMTPKLGISDAPPDVLFGEDPLENIIDKKNGKSEAINALVNAFGGKDKGPSVATELSKDDCDSLMAKIKAGEDLVGADKDKMNECLNKNIGGWTPDQIEMAKTLVNDQTLSPEERDLLRKGVAGELSPEDMAIAKALVSSDPQIREAARQAVRSGDEEAKKALANALMGKKLDEKEKNSLQELATKVAESLGIKPQDIISSINNGSDKDKKIVEESAEKKTSNGELSPEQIKQMADEVAKNDQKIKDLENKLQQAQADAASAAQKLADGKMLSEKEQQLIQKLGEMQKQLKLEQDSQKEKQLALLKAASKLQNTLAQVAATIEQVIPSDFTVAYEDVPYVDCKKVKPLKVTRVKKPKTTILDVDGKPLSPDKVKLLGLRRKKMIELQEVQGAKASSNLASNFAGDTKPINVNELMAQNGGQGVELSKLFVYQGKTLKPFTLSPDMKIPAMLLSQILVSSRGKPQSVRVKILDTVRDPETTEIVIPKGSTVVGSTQGFDDEIGVMDLSFDKVTVGSGKVVPVKFIVGSADGSMGLKGQVRDTRGKYLAGAFITSFSAGALNWFSQQVVAPFQSETDVGNAIAGASLSGGADVMSKIAEMFSSDLQNAQKIFYVPKGVPLILYPNE